MDRTPALAPWPIVLPHLAPGETLYSWCGWVHRRTGSGSALSTSRRLFGSSYAALLHDFPARLAEFTRRTEGKMGKPRDLALGHTLLGYFLPFCHRTAGENVLSKVVDGSNPDVKMRLGITASGIGAYHPLRCCRDCILQDLDKIGWPIWRVHHQCPSTLVCTVHQRPLVQYWHPTSPVHQREWLVPDARPDSNRKELVVRSDKGMEVLLRLAELSANTLLLAPGTLAAPTTSMLYRRWARIHDGLTLEGSIRHDQIRSQLQPKFSLIQEAFSNLGPVACSLNLGNIISSVMRKNPKPAHPAKHLVLLATMFTGGQTLSEIVHDSSCDTTIPVSRYQSISNGHDLDAAREGQRATFSTLVKSGQGVRKAAIGAGISVTTGVQWARQLGVQFTSRAKVLKEDVVQRIRADICTGCNRREISARYEISITSINRLLSTDHDLRDEWLRARRETALTHHRRILNEAIECAPLSTPTELRKLAGSSWIWLYRHDKYWLKNTLPSLWAVRPTVEELPPADSDPFQRDVLH